LIKLVTCRFVLVTGTGAAGPPLRGDTGPRSRPTPPARHNAGTTLLLAGRPQRQRRPCAATGTTTPGLRCGWKRRPAATPGRRRGPSRSFSAKRHCAGTAAPGLRCGGSRRARALADSNDSYFPV